MKKLWHIVKGWWLWIVSDAKTNDMARERNAICSPCQHRIKSINVCGSCGCFLPAKQRVSDEDCPNNYW